MRVPPFNATRSRHEQVWTVCYPRRHRPFLPHDAADLTEAQLLTGQGINIDDWKRLLDAGADADTLHDLNQRSEHPSLGSLGHLITHQHRLKDPRHRMLMDVMKHALRDGMVEPHVLTFRVLCAAPTPPEEQLGNVVVDSQVLYGLIEELYFDPNTCAAPSRSASRTAPSRSCTATAGSSLWPA